MPKKPFHSDRKPFGNKEEKPFNKFRKPERSFRKPASDKEERPYKKSQSGETDRVFKKPFVRKEDRPFKKPFETDGEKPFRKFSGQDKPFRGSRDQKGGKPFRKPEETPKEEKRPNRYANAFGKLDDEELAVHQKKQQEKKAQKEQQEEVTFSKELDRWEQQPSEKQFGKSDIKPGKREKGEDGKRHRHDARSRFRQQFDDENPHEKMYTAKGGRKEASETREEEHDKPMPLNKFIAHCDICSRRDAVTLVKEGKVTVNGTLITEPGFKINPEDIVTLNGKELKIQKNLIYILMNKPKGFITTTDDPKGRRTVMELVQNLIDERVFPVGRLDRNTTGLLLLTNDGELTQKLAHPKYGVKKVYKATLDKALSKEDFEKIKEGLILEDGKAEVDELEYLDSKNEIGLEIHSGRNRIVRRIFESLGYEVEKLDRVMYAGLTKKNILRGKWRFLTKQEVINLKHLQ